MLHRQRTTDEMLDVGGPVTEEVEVKRADQVMEVADVMELEASPELDPRKVEAMSKAREAMYPVWSLHNTDFRELVEGHELTHGRSSWKYVLLWFSDSPCIIRRCLEDCSSDYDVLTLE